MKKLKKCIVTGGAGFIGSHLCDSLVEKDYEVFCLDNLITGSERNILHLKRNPLFHFLNFDIIKPFPKKIERLLEKPDYIYHLASPASPPMYRKYSVETLLVNSIGTHHLLELASNYNCRFLLASTSAIYGNPLIHPQKEDYYVNVNSVGTRACYDEGKRFAEAITMEYIRKFKLRGRIIRIFNTYGPRMEVEDGRVVSNFINQALAGRTITVYGKGRQTRSFCYISDMVRGIILVMEKEGIDGEVINLGNPDEKNIEEIGKIILKHTGSKSTISKDFEIDKDDPERRKPDISKAAKLLNWSPGVSLANGLIATISYFKGL